MIMICNCGMDSCGPSTAGKLSLSALSDFKFPHCSLAYGQFSVWEAPAGNHGSCIHQCNAMQCNAMQCCAVQCNTLFKNVQTNLD